jgi:hypothetical protein
MGFEPQNMGLNWVTYFLQMIVCFFVRKILFNGIDYFAFLVYMKLHSVRSLIVRRPPFFFSWNTSLDKKTEILRLSSLQEAQRCDHYLGLPFLIGKFRIQSFKSIKDRVRKRLNNWVKFLSQVGKEILLKVVVQAIPTYCISVFQLPVLLCKEINGLMQKFWQGHMAKMRRYTGWVGREWGDQKMKEEWDSEIWLFLTKLYR